MVKVGDPSYASELFVLQFLAEPGMQLGVVTTSYPRFPGDPAGNFVAAHVAALRALGHHVEVIAAGGGATDNEPRDAARGGVNRPALPGEPP
ncbi:MAG TPA: hypothetical protein VF516_15220, partial [Kofleriaceae bacterium]